jgi:hypothetical protein
MLFVFVFFFHHVVRSMFKSKCLQQKVLIQQKALRSEQVFPSNYWFSAYSFSNFVHKIHALGLIFLFRSSILLSNRRQSLLYTHFPCTYTTLFTLIITMNKKNILCLDSMTIHLLVVYIRHSVVNCPFTQQKKTGNLTILYTIVQCFDRISSVIVLIFLFQSEFNIQSLDMSRSKRWTTIQKKKCFLYSASIMHGRVATVCCV